MGWRYWLYEWILPGTVLTVIITGLVYVFIEYSVPYHVGF